MQKSYQTWIKIAIYMSKKVALRNSINAICLNFPEQIEGVGVLCRVDSKVLFDTKVCKDLFWLLIEFAFTSKLE